MLKILDSTLREGEQTPGVTFSIEEKLKIASYLNDFGIDIIEAGHPRVSRDIYKSVKEISNQGLNAEILAHCRAINEDIDIARECDVDWVGIFFCVSNKRLEQQFRTNIEKAIGLVTKSIEYAKSYGLKVRYTPEDAVRTDYNSLLKISKAAVNAGADKISIADTVGAMTPKKIYDLFKKLKSDLDASYNVHCHNDLGLATANSLAAYEGGATTIDVSVNGLGERVGIAPISEICVALHCAYNIKNRWKLEMLPEITEYVSKTSGIFIPQNTPIIGKNAFSHNAGLHVAAVLNDPCFYEVIPAELVGKKRDFVLDKMASVQTIRHKLKEMNIQTDENNVSKLMNYVKTKEKGEVSDYEIISLLNESEINKIAYQ
jgi:2-isopropylmalate synthase